MTHNALISIGSNIQPEFHVAEVVALLKVKFPQCQTSSFKFTKAIGPTPQPDFLNGVVMVETTMTADALRDYLKQLEDQLKRDRTQGRFAPRTMDLDVLVYDDAIIDDDVYERSFLKDFILELIPDFQIQKMEK